MSKTTAPGQAKVRKTPETPPHDPAKPAAEPGAVEEVGGRDGPDPTRYGDWEYKGRCIDF